MTSADFALARQRLAARRQHREVAARTSIAQNGVHITNTNHLPASINSIIGSVQEQWNTIKGREGTRPAFRVGQVDAELLDEELIELLKGQAGEALKYFGSHLREDWSAEILLFLRAILFKLSIWDHGASYGAALQNLRYTDARSTSFGYTPPQTWQKICYGLFSVGGRYAWTKWEDWLLDAESGYQELSHKVRSLSKLSTFLSTVHSIFAFSSFLVFLLNGKYRTILDRVLRLRLTPTTSRVGREVSFEYLNRQLVWHAFTEFLLFLLPLVGISRWRRWLSRAWRKTTSFFRPSIDEEESDRKVGGELSFLPERTCAICYQDQNPTSASENEVVALSTASSGVVGSSQTDITNPYEAIPCGCIYDFVCLAERIESEEGEGWVCLRCGEIARECRPWHGDVIAEVKKSGLQKSVGFVEEERPGMEIKALEPSPEDDGLTAIVEAEIETEAAQLASQSLIESPEWARVTGLDDEDETIEHDSILDEYDEGASETETDNSSRSDDD